MATRTITTPNVTFEAFDEGRGPLVLCLHGFPDQAGSFRHQIPALVGAGYRVVAPYMRGYAPTTPPNDGRFDAMALGEDVVALLDALEAETAVVFGHDWGAVATYFGALSLESLGLLLDPFKRELRPMRLVLYAAASA